MLERLKKKMGENKKFKRDFILTCLVALVLGIVILNHIFFGDNMYVMLGGVIFCGLVYLWLAKILVQSFILEKKKKNEKK